MQSMGTDVGTLNALNPAYAIEKIPYNPHFDSPKIKEY